MATYLDVDKVGRMVLPKAVREQYGIAQGGRVEVIDTGQGVLLRPAAAEPAVTHLANGFPVFAAPAPDDSQTPTGQPDTTDLPDLIARSRVERDRRNATTTKMAR